MDNSLYFKHLYTGHRRIVKTAIPPLAPDGTLAQLLISHPKGPINADGFDTLHGFVKFVGGAGPTVTLQPLELVNYVDGAGVAQQRYVIRGSNTAALAEGISFEIPIVGGGMWFMRVDALTGAPTTIEVYLAGGLRANEGSI